MAAAGSDEYVPAAQGVQTALPATEMDPCGQSVQLVLPRPEAYFPAGQAVHSDAPFASE